MGKVDRWRAGNEMETSRSMKRRGGRERGNNPKEREKEKEGRRRRIAFRLCSIKGEITHLLRFFLKTTALIDQTAWMYQPIFNMKYRHQKSITPVFSLPSPISQPSARSFSQRLTHLHHCPLSSLRLSPCLSSSQAMDLPLSPPDMGIMLSASTWAWQMEKSIIFNNYLTFFPFAVFLLLLLVPSVRLSNGAPLSVPFQRCH